MTYRYLFLGVSLALDLVLGWTLLWGENGAGAYRSLKREYAALGGRIESLQSVNLELSREIKLLQNDKRFIEQTIRKRLNFIKDNELLYIFPDAQAEQTVEGLNEPKN